MIGRTRWRFRSVESTQDVAFRLAGMGAKHGTLVRADFQSAGRGRVGRVWEAPVGTSLMFSTILRPTCAPHQLGTLPMRIATVLADVFAELGASEISVKWPNDVLIAGRKTSGILVQTRMMPELVAVIGIGINVSASPESGTNLSQAIKTDIDGDHLLDLVLDGLDHMWSNWQPAFTAAERSEIEQRLWLQGEDVTLRDADREIAGSILGVAADGGLRLLVGAEERVLHVGEILQGPRPTLPKTTP